MNDHALLCALGIHSWGQWKDQGDAKLSSVFTAAAQPVLLQEKRCKHCDMAKRRIVRYL